MMPLLLALVTLAVVLALCWGRFRALGLARLLRLALLWAAIILALMLLVRILNLQEYLA